LEFNLFITSCKSFPYKPSPSPWSSAYLYGFIESFSFKIFIENFLCNRHCARKYNEWENTLPSRILQVKRYSFNNCTNNYFIVNMISTWSKTVCNDSKVQKVYSGVNRGEKRFPWGNTIETETWWTRRKYQLKRYIKALKQTPACVKVQPWEGPWCLPRGKKRPLWLKKNKWIGLVQYEPGEKVRNQTTHSLIDHNIFGFYPQSNEFNARKWHD